MKAQSFGFQGQHSSHAISRAPLRNDSRTLLPALKGSEVSSLNCPRHGLDGDAFGPAVTLGEVPYLLPGPQSKAWAVHGLQGRPRRAHRNKTRKL